MGCGMQEGPARGNAGVKAWLANAKGLALTP